MSGVPEQNRIGRKAFTRPSRLLLGILVIAVAAGALALVTIRPPATPPRPAKQAKATAPGAPTSQPPAFGDDIALPAAEIPPAPTVAEIKRPAVEPAAAPPPATDNPPPSGAVAGDPESLSLADLKKQAEANDLPSMIEMGRRLILGVGIAKDPPAGAGWMLHAAELGSPQAAFNVGVMYESGFVVERDSAKAAQWYRRAAEAGVPAAQHNLALLLRTGKGVPRDQAQAVKLLQAAAHQGMAAAMFTLADVYERGDAAPKDLPAAVAWFGLAAQFERDENNGDDTPLAKAAVQRAQALQRVLTPAELRRARDMGQSEIGKIVAGLPSTSPPPQLPAPALPSPAPDKTSASPAPSGDQDVAAGWPSTPSDQVRAIQQALVDLKLLRDKPDGVPGPMTSSAIRGFQRSIGVAETGEPNKDVYVALKQALAKRATSSPPTAASPQAPKSTKP
ncbi:Sel1 repeat-containing protein [Enhydrobacter aerosaccus]|uniref:Sel1 repeat-containing protein n=1 Tax=Enhydrobacter aerosaccus TaxID=225324 RepID=A0A1T4MZP3_9HYPH|nr:SEL1-like repeat protein [Enhydrobacter aerosaccus]SJZ72257.1 Sel1 repeat-containing protein [Enhydrobacter aerosaccus]